MEKHRRTIHVRCTCCDALLSVEPNTGTVLFTEKAKKKHVSFEEAVSRVQKEKDMADERFRKAVEREGDRKKLVDRKFEEALKHTDELERPVRPIDLD